MRAIPATFLLAIGLALAAPASARAPKVGEPAPDFSLTLIDGNKVALAELKGEVIIFNFWATWCAPCKKELPTLDAFYRAYKDKGLRVYAVTTEDSLPLGQLKSLFAVMAVPSVRYLKGPYKPMGAVPTNIVIGRDGRVRYAAAGAFDLDKLNQVIVPLLNEPAPASIAALP